MLTSCTSVVFRNSMILKETKQYFVATWKRELSWFGSEHEKAGKDEDDDEGERPLRFLQFEHYGEHEDENDAGRLGHRVQRHRDELETPIR